MPSNAVNVAGSALNASFDAVKYFPRCSGNANFTINL